MKTQYLNYSILIEPDKRTGTNDACYSIFCPILCLADSGETIEEAMANMKNMIKFHLECLNQEGEELPSENAENKIFSNIKIPWPNFG